MAQSILKLKVDSTEYEGKIKRAAEGLRAMESACRSVGGTFEVVEKEELAFVEALGKMDTVGKNAKSQMRELQQALTDLTMMYRGLSDAEKSSPFGKALNKSIQELTERAGNAKNAMMDVQQAITNAASDTRKFDQFNGIISTSVSTFQSLTGAAELFGVKGLDNVEVLAKLQSAMALVNGLSTIQNALQEQSAMMQGLNALKTAAAATAQGLYALATGEATAAQTAFNIAADANPWGALIAVIGLAAGAIAMFTSNTEEATEAEKTQQMETQRLAKRHQEMSSTIGKSTGDILGRFLALQLQWKALRTEGEKNQWLKENANNFKSMGLSIKTVNDANTVFVRKAPEVIQAIMAIALAQKAADKYADAVMHKQEAWVNRSRSRGTGDYYNVAHAGDEFTGMGASKNSEWVAAGLNTNVVGGGDIEQVSSNRFRLTAAGAKKLNAYRNNIALTLNKSLEATFDDEIAFWKNFAEKTMGDSLSAQSFLNSMGISASNYDMGSGGSGHSGGGHSGGSGSGGSGHTGGGTTTTTKEIVPKAEVTQSVTQLQVLQDQLTTVQNSMKAYGETTDEWKTMNEEAKSLTDQINELNGVVKPIHLVETSSISELQYLEEYADTIQESMKNAANAEDWVAMNEELQGVLDKINAITGNGKEKSDGKKKKKFSLTNNKYYEAASGLRDATKDITSALESWGVDFSDGFKDTLSAIDGVFSLVEGIQAIISVIQLFTASNDSIQTGLLTTIAANTAISAASDALHDVPVIGTFLARGGVVHAAGGVRVPGNYMSGDRVPAMLNSGELVLNRAQQGNIASQLQGSGFGQMQLSATIKGEDIRLALNNNSRRRGKGEYVTSRA